VLVATTLQVQFFSVDTALGLLVLAIVLLGIPNGFNNISLQTALYDASPPERAGSIGGLFQLFRYLGAIGAMSVLALIFEHDLTDAGLHRIGVVMTVLAVGVLGLAVAARRLHPQP
jgi:MFS family permease